MSLYVADVFGYVMTGPPLVYQSLRVMLPDDGMENSNRNM